MNLRKNPNCDGQFCTCREGEVRILPAYRGGRIQLCFSCYTKQILFRKSCNRTLTMRGVTDPKTKWSLPPWSSLEVYTDAEA